MKRERAGPRDRLGMLRSTFQGYLSTYLGTLSALEGFSGGFLEI